MALQKILFIDRDGTLIKEPKDDFQVDSFEKFELMENVIPALLKLKNLGYKLVMVTNQDGLGTDSFPEHTFHGPQNLLIKILNSQGIYFEDVLICPHFNEDNCACRKPKVKMLLPFLLQNNIDRDHCYVIGDRATDVELAENLNIKSILFDEQNMNWQDIMENFSQPNRYAKVVRNTTETKITVEVWLDQQGNSQISSGVGFFDHMLTQIATHAGIRLNIKAIGDLHIDDHHTVEDVGLALGEALSIALGDKRGITRYAFVLPMDECESSCSLDLSGRPYLKYDVKFKFQMLNDLNSEMIEHFFRSLSYTLACNLHLKTTGDNGHHIAESSFKSFARCLKQAIKVENDILPSSKGVL